MIITFEQGLALFGLACSGLGLFAWLMWWLAGQFIGVRSLIHTKHGEHEKRISKLEWHMFGAISDE